jgi:DNA polymerase I-like protein with 3'-5' exonuclease and polymerase domains
MSGSDADALKELAADLLREYAVSPNAEKAKNELFGVMGCIAKPIAGTPKEKNGWFTVNRNSVVMTRYAGSDVLDLAAVLRVLPPIPVPESVMDREREFQAACAPLTHIGFALDYDHVVKKTEEEEKAKEEAQKAVHLLSDGKIANPKSPDVLKMLPEVIPGLILPIHRKTKQPTADKGALEGLCLQYKDDPFAFHLMKQILAYRHHDTTLGLLLEPFRDLCEHGDGRMRSTIYTIEASTGRTCIPHSHQLITDRGIVSADMIRPGMSTLDAQGEWVRVLEIHRYPNAPLLVSDNGRGLKVEFTAEHNWVTTLEHRPAAPRELRTLVQRTGTYRGVLSGRLRSLRVHLAPEGEFDFRCTQIPAVTGPERFAALIGLLVTDGTCKDYGRGTGLRVKVYQTEKKFYKEFLRVIPPIAIMSDRLTKPVVREIRTGRPLAPVTDHHEIRIKARWLRPELKAAGLFLPEGTHLRDCASLWAWVAALPLNELRAFFTAAWLADGQPFHASHRMSCGSKNLRRVLTLAAYRLGYVTTEHQPERPYISFCRPVLSTRRNPPTQAGYADTWCVTTQTGTFTAVTPEGVIYLTGNSSRRQNIQQMSRQGGIRACIKAGELPLNLSPFTLQWEYHKHAVITPLRGISADFQGCEVNVAAALSGDKALYEAETGSMCWKCESESCGCEKPHTGLHWLTAHTAFGKDATKEHRYWCKRAVFCRLFGGGAETAAAQAYCEVSAAQKVYDAFAEIAPAFTDWDKWLRQCYREGSVVWRDYSTGTNYAQPAEGSNRMIYRAYSGRNIYISNGQHAAGNGAIQGTARELLVDGVLNWRKTRWGLLPIAPVHDEIDSMVPASEALEARSALVAAMTTTVLSSPGFEVRIGADVSEPWQNWPDPS